MEKKYDIDVNELKSLKKMIKKYDISGEYISDIYVLDILIDLLCNNEYEENEEISFDSFLVENIDEIEFLKKFYPYIRLMKNSSLFLDDSDLSYQKIVISDEDTFSLVYDFFKQQGSHYQAMMDEVLKESLGHVKFIKPTPRTDGETFFIKSTGDFFSVVPNYQSIMKPAILTHEITHVLDWYSNNEFLKNFLIAEAHSLLMEMVSSDYYNKVLSLECENIKRRRLLHSLILLDTKDIYNLMQIIHMYKIYGSSQGFEKILNRYDTKYINFLMRHSPLSFFSYQLSYLIAIELYYRYHDDKEIVQYFLKMLVNYGTNENIFYLLEQENIKLGENFKRYEKSLILKKD